MSAEDTCWLLTYCSREIFCRYKIGIAVSLSGLYFQRQACGGFGFGGEGNALDLPVMVAKSTPVSC